MWDKGVMPKMIKILNGGASTHNSNKNNTFKKRKKNYVQKLDLLQQPKINKFMFGFKEVIGKKNRKAT